MGSRGLAGRLFNSRRVALFPGANSAPSNACRPEESSPNWTYIKALAARNFSLCCPCCRLRLRNAAAASSAHFTLVLSKSVHWPAANLSNLAINAPLLMCPPLGRLWSNIFWQQEQKLPPTFLSQEVYALMPNQNLLQ